MTNFVGHLSAGKRPTGEGPRREFRALTSAGLRHDTEWAEKNLQGGGTGGAHSVQLRSGFEREWRERGRATVYSSGCGGGGCLAKFVTSG